ncbi:unnamed protein product [Calypogeia fissa]
MLPMSRCQDGQSDSCVILTKASPVSDSPGRQRKEKRERKSNKDFNLEAIGFQTYEPLLFQALQESGHAQFLGLIGMTRFLRLSWTGVHIELAMEFLKNYRKKKSTRISLSSSVRNKKITLTKKLIASTFHLSSTGYKHKNRQVGREALSFLFDPATARRNGYYIRDCRDPTYFERLEAFNRLICFKPPGHLVSSVLVDMVIHAAIEPVDWAGLMLFSLMKELDRVKSSLRQPPCTLVGVHIFLILSNLKIVTPRDSKAVESLPYLLLDGYSTSNSVASDSVRSSPTSSPQASPRSSTPGLRLTEILGLSKEVPKTSKVLSSDFSQLRSGLADDIGTHVGGQKSSTVRSSASGSRLAGIFGLRKEAQKTPKVSSDSSQLGSVSADDVGTHVGGQKSSTVPSGSIRIARRAIPALSTKKGSQKSSTTPSGSSPSGPQGHVPLGPIPYGSIGSGRKYQFALRAVFRLYLTRVFRCFSVSD